MTNLTFYRDGGLPGPHIVIDRTPVYSPLDSDVGNAWRHGEMDYWGEITLSGHSAGDYVVVRHGCALVPVDDYFKESETLSPRPGLEKNSLIILGYIRDEEDVASKGFPALCVNLIDDGFNLSHLLPALLEEDIIDNMAKMLKHIEGENTDLTVTVERDFKSRKSEDIILGRKLDHINVNVNFVEICFGDNAIRVELHYAPTSSGQLMTITSLRFNRNSRQYEVKEELSPQDVLTMYGVLMVATAKPLGEPESE